MQNTSLPREAKTISGKIFFAAILGNILEYYDFLLFIHLGPILTPLFFPESSPTASHLLSMVLFGVAFLARPIGGVIFGKMGDTEGRKKALSRAVLWSVFPALGIAILPGYEVLGIMAPVLLILLRFMQGVSLGGEYASAGVFLMEHTRRRKNVVSACLTASGGVGSLMGLGLAYLLLQKYLPEEYWRVGFIIGAILSYLSFYLRKYLTETRAFVQKEYFMKQEVVQGKPTSRRMLALFFTMMSGVSYWLPVGYSSFFLTKIMNLDVIMGVRATFYALCLNLMLLPLFGALADRMGERRQIMMGFLILPPFAFLGIFCLQQQWIFLGQLSFLLGTSFFSAPTHKFIGSLFPVNHRCLQVGILFSIGAAFGGFTPFLSGMASTQLDSIYGPAWIMFILCVGFAWFFKKNLKDVSDYLHKEEGPIMTLVEGSVRKAI